MALGFEAYTMAFDRFGYVGEEGEVGMVYCVDEPGYNLNVGSGVKWGMESG